MSKIQKVSDICDKEIKITECFTPKVLANSGMELKLLMYESPKPLVICKAAPNNMAKMKKIAILLSLKSVNAFNPSISTIDFDFSLAVVGQLGSVNEYRASRTLAMAET